MVSRPTSGPKEPAPLKRILVINPFGIGDVIFSMVLVEALRRLFPDAFIGFLCNERTEALVRMNTSINRTFVFNRDLLRGLLKKSVILYTRELKAFWGHLREFKFDTVFDLSLGREFGFFSMMIGIKKRIGFNYKGRGFFLTQKRNIRGYSGRSVADAQLELLRDAGAWDVSTVSTISLTVSDSARSAAAVFLKRQGVTEGSSILSVAPGGGKSWGKDAIFKQWDPERFAKVLNRLTKDGPFVTLLLGDQSEKELLDRTARSIESKTLIVAGEPLDQVAALLLHSTALLSNDGGLMHLANALGVRTVSIFGPVDEKVYGPYRRDVRQEVVVEPVPCRPCYQRFYFPPCPYERRCLDHLSVDKVIEAASRVLAAKEA